jgi:hypothetical protein
MAPSLPQEAATVPCGKAESSENTGGWTCLPAEIDPTRERLRPAALERRSAKSYALARPEEHITTSPADRKVRHDFDRGHRAFVRVEGFQANERCLRSANAPSLRRFDCCRLSLQLHASPSHLSPLLVR